MGRQYRRWLAEPVEPGTVDHDTTLSILVPVYDPPVKFLRECLASVLAQSARNWQLVVVDDGSTDADVTALLDQFAAQHRADPRVVAIGKENGGISSALNQALAAATGDDAVGMLDHDDLLDPRCVEEFTRAIEEHEGPDAVYSDEDKVDFRGRHFELYCKPDFSPSCS